MRPRNDAEFNDDEGRTHGSAPTHVDGGGPFDDGRPPIDGGSWGEHAGSPLYRVLQWFKTMTTNEYIRGVKTLGWPRFRGKLWQRDYYEHIIRSGHAYQQIAAYIVNNPANWK
jgi:hypothetical protein